MASNFGLDVSLDNAGVRRKTGEAGTFGTIFITDGEIQLDSERVVH
jgi:hypothetical protein